MSIIVPFQKWLKEQPANNENDERLFLTEEEVRAFPQFKDATAEEIAKIIDTLHALALITYDIFCKQPGNDEIPLAA